MPQSNWVDQAAQDSSVIPTGTQASAITSITDSTSGTASDTVYFPGTRYSPSGEKRRFEREEDVPAGWHRNTPEGLAKLGKAPPKPKGGDLPADLDGLKKGELLALAEKEGVDTEAIEGSGKNGNVLAADIRAAIEEKRK